MSWPWFYKKLIESLKLYFNFRSLKCLKPSWNRVKSVITLIFWQTYTAVGAVFLCKEEKAESDTFYLVRVDSFFWKNVFFALKVEICLAHTECVKQALQELYGKGIYDTLF